MCILFIAVQQHPEYPLIICANRDEFHQRPTQKMHWWPNNQLLAGKDLQAGGTWLGISPSGKFSALTNFRQPQSFDATKRSRGDLVLNALATPHEEFKQKLVKSAPQYNGYNLLFGDCNNLTAYDSVSDEFKTLSQGFYSICNGALNDIWPKMSVGIEQLKQVISTHKSSVTAHTSLDEKSKELDVEQLFAIMSDQQTAIQAQLPKTGVPDDIESLLSSIFICSTDYGTRSTSIILQAKSGQISVYERNYDHQARVTDEQIFKL
jgi:uncharacterized protein with NRDE domain